MNYGVANSTPEPNGDTVYFDDGVVKVTSTRYQVNRQVFAMSNITSIRLKKLRGSAGDSRYQFVIMGLFLMILFGIVQIGLLRLVNGVLGLLIVLGAVVAGYRFSTWWFKPYYSIAITTAAGEAFTINVQNSAAASSINDALNKAIVGRG